MSVRNVVLISILIAMLSAASPQVASAWETIFQIRAGNGLPVQERTFQALMDPQGIVTIGVEVMGIRIGYDSRNGLAAVVDFW